MNKLDSDLVLIFHWGEIIDNKAYIWLVQRCDQMLTWMYSTLKYDILLEVIGFLLEKGTVLHKHINVHKYHPKLQFRDYVDIHIN